MVTSWPSRPSSEPLNRRSGDSAPTLSAPTMLTTRPRRPSWRHGGHSRPFAVTRRPGRGCSSSLDGAPIVSRGAAAGGSSWPTEPRAPPAVPSRRQPWRSRRCSPTWMLIGEWRSCSPRSSGCPMRRRRPSASARSERSGRASRGRGKIFSIAALQRARMAASAPDSRSSSYQGPACHDSEMPTVVENNSRLI